MKERIAYQLRNLAGKSIELCALCDNESRPGLLLCEECAKRYANPARTEFAKEYKAEWIGGDKSCTKNS